MKKVFSWLISLAFLCSCTNVIEEPEVNNNASNELETKADLPQVTVTLSFLINQSTSTPPNTPSYAEIYCTTNPSIEFDLIEFPLYNVWFWQDNEGWSKVYESSPVSVDAPGYTTGLPFVAGAVTAVCLKDINIYPTSLKTQYKIDYNIVGLLSTEEKPEMEGTTGEGGGTGGGTDPDISDSLLRIKNPIKIVTK